MSLALKKSVVMRMIFDTELDKVAAIEVRNLYPSKQFQSMAMRMATASNLFIDPRLWLLHLTSTVLVQKKAYPEDEAASKETILHCEKSGGFTFPCSGLPSLMHECNEQVARLTIYLICLEARLMRGPPCFNMLIMWISELLPAICYEDVCLSAAPTAFLAALKATNDPEHPTLIGYICGSLCAAGGLTQESMHTHKPEGEVYVIHSVRHTLTYKLALMGLNFHTSGHEIMHAFAPTS